jgi:hypothetical protein
MPAPSGHFFARMKDSQREQVRFGTIRKGKKKPV